MRKLPSRKILATLIAGVFFIPQTSFSLGLGEIEVSSALNQKLKADIELLSATPEDTEAIIVKLASRKEFSRAGLDRPYSLNDLRFKSEVIDGVPHIIVSSSSPIREPFLNFLVEVDWPNGHLLREYTVLLDPPVFMTKTANAVSSGAANNGSANTSNARPTAFPVRAQASFTPSSVSNSSATSPRSSSATVVQQQTSSKLRVNNYTIKSGDTAWKLADTMRPNQSVTVPQMMFAMLRSNPSAFIDENINGLKRGYILRVPNASQIAQINKAEAKALMREHWALWRQYQQAQAGGQPVSAMPVANQAASVNDVDGESSGVAGNSHLAIVSAGSGASTSGSKDLSTMTAQELRAELTLARERVESERVEKEALQSRINTLEQLTENREGLLVVEDKELSDVQALNTPVDETAVFTDEVNPQVAEEGQAAEAEAAVPENVATADASALENNVSKPSDPLSTLLNNPVLLAAAGGGLLLIVAIIALIVKRRKTESDNDEPDEVNGLAGQEDLDDGVKEDAVSTEDSAVDEHSVDEGAADTEEAEDSDTGLTKNQGLSDTTDTTESDALVTDEVDDSSDDVIAEADVYLAYGIYQQAEDLLKQALLENPERDDYRLKLAEIHYASKNAVAFVEVAGEIKNRVDDENSPEWKKVLLMGQELCANDPLFNAGTDVEKKLDGQPIDSILGINEEQADASGSDLKLDEELRLPDLDTETSDSGLATNEISNEVPEEIEFDLSDTGAIEESEVEEDAFALDISASELDISTQDVSTQNDRDGAEETDETLAEDEIDITFDLDDGSDNETEVEEEISLDLSDEILAESETGVESTDDENSKESEIEEEVSLDLSDAVDIEVEVSQGEAVDEDTHAADETVVNEPIVEESVDDAKVVTVAAANDNSGDEGDFDLTNLDDFDEVSTKLDLARAYLDMGDHDGTRGILEEVMVDGTDEQKQEANELLERLAS